MRYTKLLISAMAVTLVAASPAFAGGGSAGGPVVDPGDDPPGDDGGPTGGGGTTGGGGAPGGGGPGPSTSGYTGAIGANVFDLENFTPAPSGSYNFFTAGQSASQSVDGLTLSLTPSTGITLGLADESVFAYLGLPPADVGRQSAFDYGFGASIGLIYANFSDAISDFSLMSYKIAANYQPVVTLTAFSGLNGSGTVLGTTSGSFGGLNYQSATFSLTGLAGAQSIGFNANTRGNVWFDNFSATVAAVPEPANWALMILGFGLVGATMRRRETARAKVARAA